VEIVGKTGSENSAAPIGNIFSPQKDLTGLTKQEKDNGQEITNRQGKH